MSIPAFSVVIPLYNNGRHVARAIRSALDQTCPDFELVVVDDGSTDDGASVTETIRDDRIRLIRQANAGVSVARNRGIAETTADLVAFLDADDEWLPEHLATIKRLAKKHPECGAYATAYEEIDARNRRQRRTYNGLPQSPWEGVIPSYFRSSPLWTSAVAVPRRVLDAVGLFPVGDRVGEDLVVWCQIALRHPIAFSTQVTAVYHRETENSVTKTRRVLEEPSEIHIIKAALETGQFPAGVTRTDLIEYANMRLLDRALRNVRNGHRREARALLRKVHETRTCRGLVFRWTLLSYLPTPVLGVALALRQLAGSRHRRADQEESHPG
jgi:glycosyltransferase involved in cell wall biosynthesis